MVSRWVVASVLCDPCSAIEGLRNAPWEGTCRRVDERLDSSPVDDSLDKLLEVAGVAPRGILRALPVDTRDALAEVSCAIVNEEVGFRRGSRSVYIMVFWSSADLTGNQTKSPLAPPFKCFGAVPI